MQIDEIYKYEIQYVNEKGKGESITIFSENPDIYSLENLPESTFYIDVYHLKERSEVHTEKYLLGKPLGVEELKKEIKLIESSGNGNIDKAYRHSLTSAYHQITARGKEYIIVRKQGKLFCLYKHGFPYKIIGDVHNGKISKKPFVKIEEGDNYVGLE